MKAIASYPRSGNHLCRFIVEYVSGMSTQGIISNLEDVPICENNFPDDPNVLDHVNKYRNIGQKIHTVKQFRNYSNNLGVSFSGILLIVRNPAECILGLVRPSKFSGPELIQKINDEFHIWEDLLLLSIKNPMQTEVIIYEDLISDDKVKFTKPTESIERLFHENIDTEKLRFLVENYESMKKISASANGRAWTGIRSLGREKFYHLSRFNEDDKLPIMKLFLERITKLNIKLNQLKISENRVKFPTLYEILTPMKNWENSISDYIHLIKKP